MEKMQRPVEFKFKSTHRTTTGISQLFLKKMRYKVNYGEMELIRLEEGTIYSQRYSHYLFYIEILEIRLTKTLDMSYMIKNPALFLFFMLHGNVSFSTADGTPISDVKSGICYPTYNKSGEFFVHFPKGTHRLFYISTRPGWLKNHLDDYPHFGDFMTGFIQNTDLYGHLPQCCITKEMRFLLSDLYKIDPVSARNLEVGITNNCMGLFEKYHKELVSGIKNVSLPYAIALVKAHLDTNFTSPSANDLSEPLKKIPFTERTLRHQFLVAIKYTIHDYIEVKRVNYGHELLQKTSLSISEIAHKTGYNYHYHFSKVYKKHFLRSPNADRNAD